MIPISGFLRLPDFENPLYKDDYTFFLSEQRSEDSCPSRERGDGWLPDSGATFAKITHAAETRSASVTFCVFCGSSWIPLAHEGLKACPRHHAKIPYNSKMLKPKH